MKIHIFIIWLHCRLRMKSLVHDKHKINPSNCLKHDNRVNKQNKFRWLNPCVSVSKLNHDTFFLFSSLVLFLFYHRGFHIKSPFLGIYFPFILFIANLITWHNLNLTPWCQLTTINLRPRSFCSRRNSLSSYCGRDIGHISRLIVVEP